LWTFFVFHILSHFTHFELFFILRTLKLYHEAGLRVQLNHLKIPKMLRNHHRWNNCKNMLFWTVKLREMPSGLTCWKICQTSFQLLWRVFFLLFQFIARPVVPRKSIMMTSVPNWFMYFKGRNFHGQKLSFCVFFTLSVNVYVANCLNVFSSVKITICKKFEYWWSVKFTKINVVHFQKNVTKISEWLIKLDYMRW